MRAPGIRAAMLIASSRSLALTRKYPPNCSRVSAKGPSITVGLPSRTRTQVVSELGCNGAAPRYLPAHVELLRKLHRLLHHLLTLCVGALAEGFLVVMNQQHVFHVFLRR